MNNPYKVDVFELTFMANEYADLRLILSKATKQSPCMLPDENQNFQSKPLNNQLFPKFLTFYTVWRIITMPFETCIK